MFKDEYGDVKIWVEIVGAFTAVVLGLALLVLVIAWGSVHSDHVACLRLHEATGKATKVKASGLTRECYIRIDNEWIPADRYRGVEVGDA
jgi:deoxyhypusine synthase